MRRHSRIVIAIVMALVMAFTAAPVFATANWSPKAQDISGGRVEVIDKSCVYDGDVHKATKFNVYLKDSYVPLDSDCYAVVAEKTKSPEPGEYKGLGVVVYGIGANNGVIKAQYTYTINKIPQTIKVSTATKTVKRSKTKTKYSTAISVSGDKTALTFTKVSGNSKIYVKGNKFAVKKKTAKGTYKITVKVSAKETQYTEGDSKTVTIKVKVK